MSRSEELARIVLHVGLPKCGSSYLQAALSGLPVTSDLVAVSTDEARGAVRELLSSSAPAQGTESSAPQLWRTLASEASLRRGTTLISSELLTYLDPKAASTAVAAFGEAEVHVVVVARDLASLLPSRWQQNVKTGRRESFEDYLRRVLSEQAHHGSLDPARVCQVWGTTLPADHIHLVTVPAGDAPYSELWHRFATAAGIEPNELIAPTERVNAAMGITGAELVRRVNRHFDRNADPNGYGAMVKRTLARTILAGDSSPRPVLPPALLAQTVAITARWCAEIRDAGYSVTGSLEDLTPHSRTGGDPGAVTDTEILDLAVESVAALLRQNREQARTIQALRRARAGAPRARPTLMQRLRRRLGSGR